MVDILIPDVDDAAIARIDQLADHIGVSRQEYLHQWVRQLAQRAGRTTAADLERFSELAGDLLDDDVMRRAWE